MPDAKLTILLASAIVVSCSGEDSTTATPQQTDVAALISRGQYLVDFSCGDCHTPRDETGAPILALRLSGIECFNRLENGSCLNTRNLTNHETGLMNRTDAEIKRMLSDGVRPAATGDEPLFPVMPSYVFHNMTDADLDAIVAYLRSVPGVEHAVPPSGPEFQLSGPAVPLPDGVIPQPRADYVDQAAAVRGRYLATKAGVCIICHTGHINPDLQWLDYDAFFSGGEEFDVGQPALAISGNITSDPQTGIGGWSVADIVRVLREGIDKDGNGTCPPVHAGAGAFAVLTDADVLDIAHYIASLPPIVHETEDACMLPPM
jgi:mono/diheme cytochrome c family protein